MPEKSPRLPRRSWRDSEPGAGAPRKGRRTWQREPGQQPTGPRLTKRGKIAFTAGALLVVAAVFLIVLFWPRPPKPISLFVVKAGYQTNLSVPPNAFGARGSADLIGLSQEYNRRWSGNQSKGIDPHEETLKGDGGSVAEALKASKSPALLVYVSAQGGVDGEGPYLLPEDYTPRRPHARYRLAALLDALRQLPDKKKLLVLDVTAAPPDWPLGLLHNDFARRLEADLKQSPVPNLAVLCASGPGQRSWATEEAGRTAFAHYLLEGLKGAAASNGRVTAQSLADYVSPAVERWARHNRAALQRPALLDPTGVAGMELVVADADYAGKDPADPGPFAEPDGLRQAWQDRAELERSTPHPAVNTPHWWRLYQDTLLRCEQLARAGDGPHPGALFKGLDDLKARITRAQRLPLASRANTLTMPAALGGAVPEARAQALRQQEAALWAARDNPDAYQQKLDALLRAPADPAERQLLRGLLLERAGRSADDFDRVCRDGGPLARLDEVEAPGHPAEAHFALQLWRDLPERTARWEPARRALQTRRRAEQAALGLPAPSDPVPRPGAYSEELLPWNWALVEKGDDQRRGGEDELFGSDRDAAAAPEALGAAEKDYAEALGRAVVVRGALGARDRALAELPYYTGWLARQPPEAFSRPDEDRHAALWAKAHRLSALLDERGDKQVNDLPPLTKEVREELDALAARFQQQCKAEWSVTQQSWHELDALLAVPFVEPARREELLRRLREIGAELNRRMDQNNPGGPTEQETDRQAREAALRQGRLAVAVLGKDRPEAKLADAKLALAAGDNWAGSLVEAGGYVANGFYDLAKEAAEGAEDGRKLPLDAAAAKLRPAALQARRLGGGAVAAWLGEGADPVGQYRAVQLHDLLVWQARRTYRDYWSAAAAGAPFYRAAGGLYLDDAQRQVAGDGAEQSDEQRAARLTEVTAWGAKLRTPDQFTPGWFERGRFRPGPDAPVWPLTDEPRLERDYGVAAPAGAPPGRLALWPEPGQSLRREGDGAGRKLLSVSADPQAAWVRAVIAPEPAGAREAPEQVSGYFRGRRFALTTPVRRYYQPDLTWLQHRWEREAGVAVRADPKDFAALAKAKSELIIVLDYSGSMDSLDRTGGSPRITRALDALEGVLKQVPKGVKVGILTFSDADSKGIVVRRKPAAWDPDEDTKPVMKGLRGLKPWDETPLVEAIAQAAELFDRDVPIKKLVVLTDGGDNLFYKKLGRGNDTIERYMVRKFGDSDVQLTVIGFEINEEQLKKNKPDEYRGYKEFIPVLEKIRATYLDVKRSSELAGVLAQSLLDLRFQVDRPKFVRSASVSYFGKNINDLRALSLPDGGNYYIYLKTKALRDRDTEAQRLDVRPGDALVLDLVPAGGSRFLFRREVYADSDVNQVQARIARQPRKDGDWVVAVWQNQNHRADPRSPDALQVLVTVEKGKSAVDPDIPLRQERPDLIWFGLAAGADPSRPRPGLRFYPLPDYPAPAWRLEMPEWPRDQDVVLDGWFLDRRPLAAARLDRGTDYQALAELAGYPVEPGGKELVRVEGVGWESVAVEESPGKPRAARNCLVVRLSFPDGTKPFFARLPEELESRVAGYEHRFYQEAGKYTGIFWDVDPSTVNALTSLELISVDEARAKAPPGEKLNLGKPQGPAGAAPPQLAKPAR